jgi:cytochrome c-type biogenesis protein CcmH
MTRKPAAVILSRGDREGSQTTQPVAQAMVLRIRRSFAALRRLRMTGLCRASLGSLVILVLACGLAAQPDAGVPDAKQVVGAPLEAPLTGDALLLRTQEVAAAIRCPVCQGLSIADSPSEMAINMKSQVRDLLARGYTREQIETYFERSYGQFVLLRPKFEGVNVLVWILPIAALLAGVLVVANLLRRFQTMPEAPAMREREEADSQSDSPYLARVRRMVEEAKP